MENKWVVSDCANGKRTCDNEDKTAEDIFEVIKLLEKNFTVKYDDKCAAGLDGGYFSAMINSKKITIGWDIWSGVFIMSEDESGNDLIEDVFQYLNSIDI